MEMTFTHASPISSVVEWLMVAVVWFGPIGLFVLRKQLNGARGGMRTLKAVLISVTALTAPLAALMTLTVLFGAAEAGELLWSLLRAVW